MLLLVGAVSVLMAQRAYQAGPLVQSLPATTVLEPLVATVLAGALYGEHLAPGLLAHVLQLGGATAAAAGLVPRPRRSIGATPVPPAAPQGNRAMSRARGGAPGGRRATPCTPRRRRAVVRAPRRP